MPSINHKHKTSKKSKSSKRSKNTNRNKKTRSNMRKMSGGGCFMGNPKNSLYNKINDYSFKGDERECSGKLVNYEIPKGSILLVNSEFTSGAGSGANFNLCANHLKLFKDLDLKKK